MAKTDKAEKAYEFLQSRSRDRVEISYADVVGATGWKSGTVESYCSKHWKDILERLAPGQFRVRLDFQRITLERFLLLSTQKRTVFSRYQRERYARFVSYEFLLPLTRERELRQALDELFYIDTICHRLQELGEGAFENWWRRDADVTPEQHIRNVALQIGERFGGYSISHVSGRFRAEDLLSRVDAAQWLAENRDYLVDETTASVRFLIPVVESRTVFGETFSGIQLQARSLTLLEIDEINLIHEVFFALFAEAAVRTVGGEDQVWLVEDSPLGRFLYVWRKPTRDQA